MITQAPQPPWLQLILVPFKFAESLTNLANDKLAEILPELTTIKNNVTLLTNLQIQIPVKSFPLILKLIAVSRICKPVDAFSFDEFLQQFPNFETKCSALN